ncbi:hypothetical protein BDR05DRAFT_998234 [Suillus weaverae]|nr:hypothetical protein BDR05DRAFT_998234 [Suillus weaverae]
MVPRMETALELCQQAPRSSPAYESSTCATSHRSQLVSHPSRTTSTASSTKFVDDQPKECIEILESDESDAHTDDERQNRVQAAAGSRVQQTTPEQRVQRLNEAKTQGLIIDFGPNFIKCRCRVDIKLDSGDRQTVQKLKSGKSRKKLPKRREYDLSKYDRHLQ